MDAPTSRHASAHLLAGLNDAQRAAVLSTAAPLRIIAGAGSGKTRVLTRRIARRAVDDEIDPARVLTVTFTRKAAAELRTRLGGLGLRGGVTAGTFHGIAYAQLRQRWEERSIAPPELLDRKVGFVARLVRSKSSTAPLDMVGEIEWAKARMVDPERYPHEAEKAGRRPPFDLDVVASIFARYEEEKLRRRLVDFDDLLRLAARDLHADADYAAGRRHLYRHLFVDEFQDVNPLQFELLQAWLGDAVDLCVVGDPNQAIYAWNGADSCYLNELTDLFPTTETVTLSLNYRSTPQIIGVANVVLSTGSHHRFDLRATRGDGPVPTVASQADEAAEARAIARRIRDGRAPGEPWSSQAVLVRTNAQIAAIAEALGAARIPFRTRGAARLLDQPEIKDALRGLRTAADLVTGLRDLEESVRDGSGSDAPHARETVDTDPDVLPADERSANVAELVRLGGEYVTLDPTGTVGTFQAWLISALRDGDSGGTDSVELTTFHAAKGLEWPVVHIAGFEEGLVPIRYATTAEAQAEELRLVYVAITRAERELHITWPQRRTFASRSAKRSASPYLKTVELALELLGSGTAPTDLGEQVARARAALRRGEADRPQRARARAHTDAELDDSQRLVLDRLKRWRLDRSRAANVPAYVIFNDATLIELATVLPRTRHQLLQVGGVGPVKVERFGDEVLEVLASQ